MGSSALDAVVATLLDVLGLLAVAAGAGLAAAQWIGPGGLAVGGIVLIGGVRLAEFVNRSGHSEPGGGL